MLNKIYRWSSSWTGTIIIVLGITFFGIQAFVIPSGSMKDTLLIGDMLFVKKYVYGIPQLKTPGVFGLPSIPLMPDIFGNGHLIEGPKPKRGDIVVFLYPHDPEIHYVKRAVAIGGDIVQVKNKILYLHPKEGNEFVKENYFKEDIFDDGEKLWIINPYAKEHPGIHNDEQVNEKDLSQPRQIFNMSRTKIPEGETFMMGDNRDHSSDSRFWGTVPYKYVIGTPWFVYASIKTKPVIKDELKENSLLSEEESNKINKSLYEFRWNRMFRTVFSLEQEMLNTKHNKGIY